MKKRFLFLAAALLFLAGCDQVSQKLGLEDPAKKAMQTEAEARAVGAGCRQSGRNIEDCYAIYSWLPKANIFAGWQDMDQYMRDNKIETVVPQLPPPAPPGSKPRKMTAPTRGSQPEATMTDKVEPPKETSKETSKETAKDPEKGGSSQ